MEMLSLVSIHSVTLKTHQHPSNPPTTRHPTLLFHPIPLHPYLHPAKYPSLHPILHPFLHLAINHTLHPVLHPFLHPALHSTLHPTLPHSTNPTVWPDTWAPVGGLWEVPVWGVHHPPHLHLTSRLEQDGP